MSLCIFCFRDPSASSPFCKDNPGQGCTYGLHHETVEGIAERAKPQPIKARDKRLCLLCGIHSLNPAASFNGCIHEYPS